MDNVGNKAAIGIIKKGNYILIDLRKLKLGRIWEVPGGGIEEGETPEEAVKREIKEEVDITARSITPLGQKNEAVHWLHTGIDCFFLITSFSGEPHALDVVDKETIDAKWIKISEIKNLLNVSWRVVDAMCFLSMHFPVLKGEYKRIKNTFDNRPNYSFEQFSCSSKSNHPFFRYKNYLDMKTVGKINDIIENIKAPILQINPGYGRITNALIKKFGTVDAVELSPEIRGKLKGEFGDKIRFIDGIPEKFKSDRKYNGIIALNSYIYQPSYLLFIKSILSAINRGGKLIFSPLELKYHIPSSSYISYGHSVKLIESYTRFFADFGFTVEDERGITIDRLNSIKSRILSFKR